MITQIYSIHDIEEAKMCLAAGVDHIGVAVDTGFRCPREVKLEEAKAIFDFIGKRAKKVLIIVSKDEKPVLECASYLKPDIVHICGNEYESSPEFAKKLKEMLPGAELMQAVGIPTPDMMEKAKYFAGFCDYLILDSISPTMTSIGVAGVTHDWGIDKAIVEAVAPVKVIMAGGLGPENVYDAIQAVHPFGVDSFTRTSDKTPDGESKKNPSKIKRFVEEAQRASREIGE
ncbi:MAG: phosphoribosylanthranilate isomerase [Bacilli bacterium]|nr:phosphoribosylanthranilate isomerase [Bacilli bacterium]